DTCSSLSAAHSMKDTFLASKANSQQPEDVQTKADQLGDVTVNQFSNSGITPYAVIDDNDSGYNAAMGAFKQTHSGGLPTIIGVQQSGGKLAIFDVDAMARNGQGASLLSQFAQAS